MLSTAPPWHALEAGAVRQRLGSGPGGLSLEDAAQRLAETGPNAVPETPLAPAWLRFLAQFRNLFLLALLAAALGAAALGFFVDAVIIAVVVFINALIGFIQEDKAHRALAAIAGLLTPTARVIRAAEGRSIDARMLVPGDLVLLREGDRVPADIRLTALTSLSADEALLTGESFPAEKSLAPAAPEAIPADRTCMAFAGTMIAAGRAEGVVVETGAHTQLGKIGAALAAAAPPTSPLIREMERLAQRFTLFLLVISAGLLGFAILVRGLPAGDAFLATVAFAVAVIPEGLPAVLTITLAIGAARMAARRAIVRALPAVETLASVTVIGSDKTGTLTANALTVQDWVTAQGVLTDDAAAPSAEARALIEASLICTGDDFGDAARGLVPQSNSVDAAIFAGAARAGLAPAPIFAATRRRACLAFSSETKLMAVIVEAEEGPRLILKGAPERILALCNRQGSDGAPLDAAYWNGQIDRLTGAGRRVIAVAAAPWTRPDGAPLDHHALDDGALDLSLLGLLGLFDPVSPEAVTAVEAMREAQIRVMIVTGDHPGTAQAVAETLGLDGTRPPVTGRQIEAADGATLQALAQASDVFARTTPEHKLRLVEALQAGGEIVAMTGDGVNDAPALRAAHIGIAMGRRGSEAARQAAQIVLTDDNFATIAAAIEAGRTIFDNLRKALIFNLPTNLAQGLVIFIAIALGQALPLTPTQVLWVNLVTAVALSSPLAFEPAETDLMRRPPSYFAAGIVTRAVFGRALLVASGLVVLVLAMFWMAQEEGLPLATARSLAFNTLVAGEIGYLFSVRRLSTSALSLKMFSENRAVLGGAALVAALQILATHLPLAQRILGTAPLGLAQWGLVLASGAAIFLLLEAEKFVLRKKGRSALSGKVGTGFPSESAEDKDSSPSA
jgi:calcium-translocating P-type ATPase